MPDQRWRAGALRFAVEIDHAFDLHDEGRIPVLARTLIAALGRGASACGSRVANLRAPARLGGYHRTFAQVALGTAILGATVADLAQLFDVSETDHN